jgi:hypothetical protein
MISRLYLLVGLLQGPAEQLDVAGIVFCNTSS